MARAWIEAPFPFWGHLRRLAMETGARLDESKGLIRRTFTFHGSDSEIHVVAAELKRIEEQRG